MTSIAFTVNDLALGGIQRVTTTIANGLSSHGHDVTLVNLANARDLFEVQTTHYRIPRAWQYNMWRVQNKLSNIFLNHSVDKREIVKTLFNKQQYDVIVLNPELFIYFDTIYQLQNDAEIYLWMHNDYRVYYNTYFKNSKEELEHAARCADGIISLESQNETYWSGINPNTLKIHNPLTLPPAGALSDLEQHVIACTSRLEMSQKGLDYLIDVAKLLPENWIINIAGDGSDRDWLMGKIKENALEDIVHVKGRLNDDALEKHYSTASIFLSTSRWEGFPLAVVEAMSRGLPLVGFDIPALEEITDGGKYGELVPVGDIAAMVKIIDRLASNYDERKTFSALSVRRAQDFDIDVILEEWERKVLGCNNR